MPNIVHKEGINREYNVIYKKRYEQIQNSFKSKGQYVGYVMILCGTRLAYRLWPSSSETKENIQ